LTVTADPPDEVSVRVCVVEEFTATLPKLRLVELSVNCGLAVVPVPVSETVAVLPDEELLLTVICPLADPAAVGLNVTGTVSDWFGFNVIGKFTAPTPKEAPLNPPELIVTADVPDDVSVSDSVDVEFTATLPKFRLVELSVNCGVAEAPVPLKETTVELPVDELLLTVSCPLADPDAVGVNVTDNVIDWFGLSVAGRVPAATLKAAPLTETEFTVNDPVPDDVRVNDCVVEEFTATLPKLKLVELTVNCGVVAAV
jgi:hypothetical protein